MGDRYRGRRLARHANNQRGRIKVGDLDVAVGGRARPARTPRPLRPIAGPADPAADLRLGVLHSPEPELLDPFTTDGYDLLLAGHTHGGQLRVPGYGALVTNCGIDRARVKGMSRHDSGLPPRLRRPRHQSRSPRSASPAAPRPPCSP